MFGSFEAMDLNRWSRLTKFFERVALKYLFFYANYHFHRGKNERTSVQRCMVRQFFTALDGFLFFLFIISC